MTELNGDVAEVLPPASEVIKGSLLFDGFEAAKQGETYRLPNASADTHKNARHIPGSDADILIVTAHDSPVVMQITHVENNGKPDKTITEYTFSATSDDRILADKKVSDRFSLGDGAPDASEELSHQDAIALRLLLGRTWRRPPREVIVPDLAPEEWEKVRAFDQLRLDTFEHMKGELVDRTSRQPIPTPEERSLGTYIEGLEPQVREATLVMRAKGYKTD